MGFGGDGGWGAFGRNPEEEYGGRAYRSGPMCDARSHRWNSNKWAAEAARRPRKAAAGVETELRIGRTKTGESKYKSNVGHFGGTPLSFITMRHGCVWAAYIRRKTPGKLETGKLQFEGTLLAYFEPWKSYFLCSSLDTRFIHLHHMVFRALTVLKRLVGAGSRIFLYLHPSLILFINNWTWIG